MLTNRLLFQVTDDLMAVSPKVPTAADMEPVVATIRGFEDDLVEIDISL